MLPLFVDQVDNAVAGLVTVDGIQQQGPDIIVGICFHCLTHTVQYVTQGWPVDELLVCPMDLGVRGRFWVVADQQLFVELFPGRRPVKVMAMSPLGSTSSRTVRPDSMIILCASSIMRTGSPMSSTNTSPPSPMEPA